MSLTVGVLSDTHVKTATSLVQLMERVTPHLGAANHILHAGDILIPSVVRALSRLAPVTAVAGNMDYGETARTLPASRVLTMGGFKIVLTHGSGAPGGLEDRLRARFPDADCIVFGHTHEPANRRAGKTLLFNPGSPTDTRFTEHNWLGLITIDDTITGRHIRLAG